MKKQQESHHLALGTVWHRGKSWQRGITTGTCAAAAATAAVLLAQDRLTAKQIKVKLPDGKLLAVPLAEIKKLPQGAMAVVIKDGGDDPDITHGLPIVARVWLRPQGGIKIVGGQGVGRVTKPGLAVPPGEPAINPVPKAMINDNVQPVLGTGGVLIEISVPGGEEAARKTMNPQLGIIGGISIIGTSGIVEPMSEEAFKASLVGRVRQVKAEGFTTLVLVPGRTGEQAAIRHFGLSVAMIAQMSNFIGYMLERAAAEGFARVLLLGHIGKLIKVAGGSFHTHNRVADGRLETMAAWLGALGASPQLLKQILEQPTTEGAVAQVRQQGWNQIFPLLAEKAEEKCRLYLREEAIRVGVVMTDLQGQPLGIGREAVNIGGDLAWQGPSK